jgi:GNAT superfamily N-acetyltransferase
MENESDSSANKYRVRFADRSDLEALTKFSIQTARETLGVEPPREHVLCSLETVLSQPDSGQLFIADTPQQAVGSLFLAGKEFSEWRNGWFYYITGVYVIKDYRRLGVRFDLYRCACDWVRSQPGALGIRAHVHEKTDLATILGDNTSDHHNRPEYELEPMVDTGYRLIEALLQPVNLPQ